jgi:hypothetical protein
MLLEEIHFYFTSSHEIVHWLGTMFIRLPIALSYTVGSNCIYAALAMTDYSAYEILIIK